LTLAGSASELPVTWYDGGEFHFLLKSILDTKAIAHAPALEQIAFAMMALLSLDDNPAAGNGKLSSALSSNLL
jgi:hypothetical protein